MAKSPRYRVGVLFGGRSGEHEVSLASAQNVMAALTEAGHEVVPIGITRQGQWIADQNPMGQLTKAATQLRDSTKALPAATLQDQPKQVANCDGKGVQRGGNIQKCGEAHTSKSWGLISTLGTAAETTTLPAIDVIFPVLHGPYGEDGTIQGLLEMGNLPYVGCGVLSSAVAMDKVIAKKLFAAEGLPQTAYQAIIREQWQVERESIVGGVEKALAYPLFVKPANLGSSVGISKVDNRIELTKAIDLAAQYDRKIIVEEGVHAPREIEVSVLGISHAIQHQPIASVPGEIVPDRDFYDYEAKYHDDNSKLLIPAPLEAGLSEKIREMALRAFNAIDGSGLARVDFLLSGESGELYLNEVNTMPGFTRISMYPKLWEASGLSYPQLVSRLVELALIRHEDKQGNWVT